ncbi:MAG: hypothetical protein ACRDQU_20705 [Pseudonocardiaceae bacterium]
MTAPRPPAVRYVIGGWTSVITRMARSRVPWRRDAVAAGRTGALDLPGRTWRDRPAINRSDGVFLAGDMVAAPGLLGEVSINSAVQAAHGAVQMAGAGSSRGRQSRPGRLSVVIKLGWPRRYWDPRGSVDHEVRTSHRRTERACTGAGGLFERDDSRPGELAGGHRRADHR